MGARAALPGQTGPRTRPSGPSPATGRARAALCGHLGLPPAARWSKRITVRCVRIVALTLVAAAPAVASPASGAPLAGAPQGRGADEWIEARPFSIPNARAAQDAREVAQSLLDRSDPSDAIRSLQELIEKHRGKLLAGSPKDARGRISRELVYPGASAWAERELVARAAELGERYRERFGAEADRAFEAAKKSADRVALVALARRWPLCRAAVRAWWTVGDLELERGHARAAAAAWLRAAGRAAEIGLEPSPGEVRRADLARAIGEPGSPLAGVARTSDTPGHLALPGPDDGALDVPRFDAHSWTLPLVRDVDPYMPGDTGSRCMFPILLDDTLFVSTGFRLHAIDAYAGELRWVGDPPRGWSSISDGVGSQGRKLSDFFEAVDYENLMLAPAAADGVVVCALQIPITQARSQRFEGQFQITKIPPDRRLYAYDVETGEPLWNHRPSDAWDGETGSFTDRMSVAGPPIVSGSRLLVPMYRLQGRVEYHVACFDLFDGSLSWSTNLISGQRELNMFGRHMKEFCAPPLALAGERVIALTQLGTLAGLDLFTGDLLWESLYPQEPLPGQAHWQARERDRFWENAPPVVLGDTALATPLDSRELVAVDVATGLVRWTRPHNDIGLRRGEVTVLLGCDERSIWLCGDDEILAGHAPAPLAAGGIPETPFRAGSSFLESRRSDRRVARAVLGRRFVCVPTNKFRAVLDRHQLQRGKDTLHSAEWRPSEEPGNLALAEGALFVVSGRTVHGFFEWSALERKLRARLEANTDDPAIAARYATLLFHHAQDLWAAGRTREALAELVEARGLIEPLAQEPAADREVTRRLFAVLRAEAMVLDELAQSRLALERLAAARRLAPDRESLCAAYVQEIKLCARGERRWLQLVEDLDRECGRLVMPANEQPFQTEIGRDVDRRARDEDRLPVGLWTLLERSQASFEARDRAAELEYLHAILARYGNVAWPSGRPVQLHGTKRTADRIGTLVRLHPEAHEPFERAARSALERALAAGDEDALDEVALLWPHSHAAGEARDALLAAAAERGDVGAVARIVGDTLPSDWSPRRASRREADLMLRLATALEPLNPDCARGIRVALSARYPDLHAAGSAGPTLAEVAAEPWVDPRPPRPAERSEFSGVACSVGPSHSAEAYRFVGTLPMDPLEADVEPIVVVRTFGASDERLLAFTGDDPATPLWEAELPSTRGHLSLDSVFAAGRVVVATRDGVLAFDGTTGAAAWDWRTGGFRERVERVNAAAGVVLVTVRDEENHASLVFGLDAARGIELWRHALDADLSGRPILGDGAAVFLPTSGSLAAQVLDLFAGTRVATIPLGAAAPSPATIGTCWVENGLLVVPSFRRVSRSAERDWVVAYDLETGERAWTYRGEPGLEFRAVVQTDAGNFLVGMPTEHGATGTIVDLDTRFGAHRLVTGTGLRFDDQLLGIARHTRVRLDGPFLFVQSASPGGDLEVLRAIHPPYGERWKHTLAVEREHLRNSLWPLPVVSRDTVALVYGTNTSRRGLERSTHLLLLDRSTGERQDDIDLPRDLTQPATIELAALGSALLVVSEEGRLQLYGSFR